MARVFRRLAIRIVVGRRIAWVLRVPMLNGIRVHMRRHSSAGLVRQTGQLQGRSHSLQRQSQQKEASEKVAEAAHEQHFKGQRGALWTEDARMPDPGDYLATTILPTMPAW